MLRADVGTLAVVVLPGLLVALSLGLRLRELATWAAIPAFSLGTVFVLGEATLVLRAPFGLQAFAVLLVVLGALAVVRSRRSRVSAIPERARRENQGRGTPRTRLHDRIDYSLLALGVALGGLIWHRGLRGVPLIPPGGDATRHGWFVERIISGHSIDPSKVVTSDVGGLHPVVRYYPLALHASAALSTRVAGSDVGRVLVAYIVAFSAVVLPVGMFVLARRLAPTRALVAGFTALAVPLLMLFPYFPVWGGDVPLIVAMALVPITVVLTVQAATARQPRVKLSRACLVALMPAALAILCISAVHTSELPTVGILTLLLVLEAAWRHDHAGALRRALVRVVAISACSALLFAPTLVSFVHGVSERVGLQTAVNASPQTWGSALGAILQLHYGAGTVRQGFLSFLAIAGAVVWLVQRRPAWVVGWIGFITLSVFARPATNGFAHELTFPWYHLEWRILPNVAFFVPFFAGLALALGAAVIVRASRRSVAVIPATVAMIVVLIAGVGLHAYRANSRYIRASFDPGSHVFVNQALVADTSLAAFRWMHTHVARGDTVANQPQVDGSLWMYAEQHVTPLVGVVFGKPTLELNERLYLTEHLQALGRDPRVDRIARRNHTRWVFYDADLMPVGTPVMNLADLQGSARLSPVFHDGDSWVFRIDL